MSKFHPHHVCMWKHEIIIVRTFCHLSYESKKAIIELAAIAREENFVV